MLCASYEIRASEALRSLRSMTYTIPEPERLNAIMRERKIALLPVSGIGEPEIVTPDFESFLRCLKLNGIRTVMYDIRYYTPDDISQNYKLQDADKQLFRRVRSGGRRVPVQNYFSGGLRLAYVYSDDDQFVSDYDEYLAYTQFMISRIDRRYPRELRLYTVFQGKLIACISEDSWLMRIGMLDARQFKDNYIHAHNFRAYGTGTIAFRFLRDLPDKEMYRSIFPTRPIEPEENDYI